MKTACITLTFFVIFFFSPYEGLLVAKPIADKQIIQQNLPSQQLTFTRNDGQIDTRGKADCRFTTSVGGAQYYFCVDGIVADYQKRVNDEQENVARTVEFAVNASQTARATNVVGHGLKLNFVGRTNFLAEIHGEDEQEYKCNYFIGKVPEKWHANVPNYSRILYKNVWQGIDVAYYGAGDVVRDYIPRTDRGLQTRATLKYDVIVHPGADPKQIQFTYEGGEGIAVNNEGALVIKTSLGEVTEQKPYVYQIIDGVKKEIISRFILTELNVIAFALGKYDNTKELVIDPIYSTFLGGASMDSGNSIALDAEGNAYITGYTYSPDFPTTSGAYQLTGTYDVFVTKLNPSGSTLVYSTFLGGASMDRGNSIALDAEGNAYITGSTSSSDFPTTSGAYDTTFNLVENTPQEDAFVTKLNVSGSTLIYSTFLGGSSPLSDYGNSIALDAEGNAYIAGHTSSPDFPTTQGAYQKDLKALPLLAGYGDAFVTKVNPTGTMLLYSTFLGGSVSYSNLLPSAFTSGSGIAVDKNGNAYLTGSTNCYDFPTTLGAYQTQTSIDPPTHIDNNVFVTKFNAQGSALVYSTFLAGSSSDYGYGIALDSGCNAYITGYTYSSNFPTTSGAYQIILQGSTDAFVTKLNASGSALVYSTYLGGLGWSNAEYYFRDVGRGIALDTGGNAYISGYTSSSDFPTTPGAYQTTFKKDCDVFVTKLNASGSKLVYSTFLGGSFFSHGYGVDNSDGSFDIAVDAQGRPFITGFTHSSDFPTTAGAYQTSCNGSSDAFVTGFHMNPEIVVSDSINFGHVVCDPAQKTFMLDNAGDNLLKIDSLIFQDTTNFVFASPTTFPVLILPSSSAQISVNFKPGTPGPKTTTLRVYSNDHTPLSDSLKHIVLIGVVDSLNHPFVINKKNLDFGSMGCDVSSRDLQITVHNISNDAVSIKPIVEGAQASSYTVTPSDVTLDVNDSAVFTIHFQPIAAGEHNAALWFWGPPCLLVDTVFMTGIKNSTVSFTASPDSLEYYSCGQAMDSTIVVKNTGSTSYTLDSGVTSGSGFTLVSPKGKVTLVPGDSVVYVIRFTPKKLNKYTGTFTVSGPCSTNSKHNLIGWQTFVQVITPKNIDYGQLRCDDGYRDTIVIVKNNVGKPTLVTATIEGGGFVALISSAMVDAGSTKDFPIRFHPGSGGSFHAKLIFRSSDCPKQEDTVDIVGSKVTSTCILAEPAVLQFDTIICKIQSPDTDSIITITNCNSNNYVTLNPVQVTGNGFTLVSAAGPFTLPAGLSQDYIINFSPTGPGTYNGMFTVIGMPCSVRVSVPLLGVCKTTSDVISEKPSRKDFWIEQNYPNPFTQLSVVSYQLSVDRPRGVFEVRDMLGRTVYQMHVNSTSTQVTIDASVLPNGLYLYSLNDGINVQSRMMMVVK